MGKIRKTKYRFWDFMRNLEEEAINVMVKRNRNRALRKEYLLPADEIPQDYRKEIKEYWGRYIPRVNTDWHKFYYCRTGGRDVRYVPTDLFLAKIDKYYSDKRLARGVDDKNYYDIWFPDIKRPQSVIRKINGYYFDTEYRLLTQEEMIPLCMNHERLIVKPAIGIGGSRGIEFWSRDQGADKLMQILSEGNRNLNVQEIIRQHEDLSRIHPASVNTVRTVSLLYGGKVHILSSVLRMGTDGTSVDNVGAGGITCGIQSNGRLKKVAHSVAGIQCDKHPQGFVFSDGIVPSYDRILEIIIRQHEKLAHFRLISWDFAVDEDGVPVLVEPNLREGGIVMHQLNNGPLFGDLTEEVLEEVFSR